MPVSHSRFLLPVTQEPTALFSDMPDGWSAHPAEVSATVSRTYLDTADGRLASAGGVLQAKKTAQHLGLIFEDLHNGKPLASCRAEAIPQSVADIPGNVLRDQLTQIAGSASLLPQLNIVSGILVWVVKVAEQPVARVMLEAGRCGRIRGGVEQVLAARVTLIPVRGHEEAAAKVADWCGRSWGLQACDQTRHAQALQALAMAPA